MLTGMRQRAVVGENGKIELLWPNVPKGTVVEVIVLVDSEEQDTTDYLLSTEANRQHLQKALKDLQDPKTYTVVTLSQS
jgi:antitoxin YefM